MVQQTGKGMIDTLTKRAKKVITVMIFICWIYHKEDENGYDTGKVELPQGM
jgi:hypothetical protein